MFGWTMDKMLDRNSLILLVVVLLIPVVNWIWWRYRRLTLLSRNGIPGPRSRFLDGNFFDVIHKNVPMLDKWIKEYGKVTGYIVGVPTVAVADAELVRLIQVKFSGAPDGNHAAETSLIATGLSAERWKEQRSLITTAFTSAKIKSAVPLINDAIDALIANIREREEEEDFDIYDLYQRLTMDTIGRSAFGIHTNVQRDPNDPFFLATKNIFEDQTQVLKYFLLFVNLVFPEFTFILYPLRWIQYHVTRLLFGETGHTYHLSVCRSIIKQRKDNIADARNPWSRNDLLQQMLEASMTTDEMNSVSNEQLTADDAKEGTGGLTKSESTMQSRSLTSKRRQHRMNDNEVASNASLFFDAGYETTSTFLSFLTHVLVNRQDVQDRLRDEVNTLYEQDGRLDYNTMNNLPILDSVMYETLRYYPPVTTFVTRHSAAEYKYKNMTIPANVGIMIAVYQLHHDPDYWEDPETFDANRFYGTNKSRASSPAFQAFGAGPRNCVGLRFALMEAKLTVARLLREYKLVLGPRTEKFDSLDISYKPVTMSPKNGIYVKVLPLLERIDVPKD